MLLARQLSSKVYSAIQSSLLANPEILDTLANSDPESTGFLAFLHLVRLAYYLKNQAPFENIPSSYQNYFNNPGIPSQEQQIEWYYGI